LATTTILDFGLPANSHSGANQNRRPGVPSYLEQVVYAAAADPRAPGVHRYDHDSSDSTIPESDPRSPRNEPPHLRHRPGDTWIIDRDRLHDPLDPGPFGSPEWRPDNRTGRHRRDELPDAPFDIEPNRPPYERTTRPSPGPSSEGVEGLRPSPGRGSSEPPEPPERPRRRFWEDGNEDRYDFGKLREEAWTRFLAGSQELHNAHLIATTTFADRWTQFWVMTRALLLRVLGLNSAETGSPVDGPTLQLQVLREAAPSMSRRPMLGGSPLQGVHKSNPISPFLGTWERHFDERQAFREAVVL